MQDVNAARQKVETVFADEVSPTDCKQYVRLFFFQVGTIIGRLNVLGRLGLYPLFLAVIDNPIRKDAS